MKEQRKQENNNQLTEIVFILDASGSMHGLESNTIGGFNSMLDKQKKQGGQAYATMSRRSSTTASPSRPSRR